MAQRSRSTDSGGAFRTWLSAPPGRMRAVVKLDEQTGSGAFAATLLQPQGSNRYQLTGRRLRIELAADLSVAMGDTRSLRPGAVVQVSGHVSGADTINVHQATLLTGFVTVSQ